MSDVLSITISKKVVQAFWKIEGEEKLKKGREKSSWKGIVGFCKYITKSSKLTAKKVKAILTSRGTKSKLHLKSDAVLSTSKLYLRFDTGDKNESMQDSVPPTCLSDKLLRYGQGAQDPSRPFPWLAS